MSATSRTNWFWSDWLGDQAVRRLTPAERGVWIDLLGIAAAANPVGYVCDDRGRTLTLDEMARVTNAGTVDELSKLITGIVEKGAASRDRAGRLFNRRMVREAETAAKRRLAGKLGGEATKLKWQGFIGVPGQTARQVPGQRAGPLIHSDRKTTSRSEAPREEPVERRAQSSATPPAESPEGPSKKLPAQVSRAELDALLAAKRKPARSPA